MAGGLPAVEAVCCAGSVFLWSRHVHSVLRASDLWWLLKWCCQAPGPWRCRCLCSSLQVITAFDAPQRQSHLTGLSPGWALPGSCIPKGRADFVRGLGRGPQGAVQSHP